MLEKKRSETLLKIISYVQFLKNFLSNIDIQNAHPELSQATNINILTWRQYREESRKTEV